MKITKYQVPAVGGGGLRSRAADADWAKDGPDGDEGFAAFARQREERYQAALAEAASLPAVQVDQYELVNLTPHEIALLPDGETKIIVSPSGTVARVEMARVPGLGGLTIGGVPVWRTTVASRGVLPLERESRYYLVSRVVAEAHPDRFDLLIPDEAVRDAEGRIIGCRALASVADLSDR